MSSKEENNKVLIRRFLEAHAKGDLDTLEEMLAPDFVNHNLIPGQQPGREGYLRSFTEYHAAYSHTRYVIEKQLAEGDEVVTTFAVSATHDRGEWMGFVPTGRKFEALLVLIHRIVGGRIADEWSQGSGLAELTQQRLEQERRQRERIEQESYRWHEASSRPHCPKRCREPRTREVPKERIAAVRSPRSLHKGQGSSDG